MLILVQMLLRDRKKTQMLLSSHVHINLHRIIFEYLGHKGIGKVVPMLNEVPHHKDIWGSEDIAPCILNLGTRWW